MAEDASEVADPARPSGNGTGNGAGAPLALASAGGEPPAAPKPRLKKLRMAIVLLGLSFLALVSWVFGIMMAVAQDLPALESRAQYDAAQNSVVYDVEGKKLATLTNNEGRIIVESDQIAPSMKEAVVAIEDERFYGHRGVDFQGIARALYQDVLAGSAQQGGSTITQQFVKNALEAQDSRTILQKLREAALAYQLERNWNKDKILTEYLNSIYFGEGAYGIEAAAKTYFGSEHPNCGEDLQEGGESCASQLLPWEAAMLAGIISSPTAYSPRTNPPAAVERRNLVLGKMAEQGFVATESLPQYEQEQIPVPSEVEPPAEDSAAPYFTSWLRQQLVDHYGAGQAFAGGLKITSTLDLDLQRELEGIVASRLAGIEPTASVVVLENTNAGVRAMVGGSDYKKEPFNLATNGRRQPGSSFKPFTLVTALEQGRSPDEVFASAPQQIPFQVKERRKGGGYKAPVPDLFEPANYDDSYLGSASLTAATTYSDNSVYAQVGTQVGPSNVAAVAKRLGVQTDISTASEYSIDGGPYEPYNPGLILGGLEIGVTPLEMAHSFNALANEGRRVSGTLAASDGGPLGIEYVKGPGDEEDEDEFAKTADGTPGQNKVLYDEAVSPDVAGTATGILETVVTSGTGENAATGEPTWGKTGTTDDNGDAWFVGATDEITVAVWVGHADSVTPMLTEFGGQPVDGGTFPALIFADVVNAWEDLQAARDEPDDAEETEEPYVPPVAPVEEVPAAPVEEAPAPVEPTEPVAPVEEPSAAGVEGGVEGKRRGRRRPKPL
ncbi:MAG: transglycosylase domain-containing protein [Solirubrobacterales bacterium]